MSLNLSSHPQGISPARNKFSSEQFLDLLYRRQQRIEGENVGFVKHDGQIKTYKQRRFIEPIYLKRYF